MITVPETGYSSLSCHNDVFLSLRLCTWQFSCHFLFLLSLKVNALFELLKELIQDSEGVPSLDAVSTTFNQSLLMCILAWDFLHV
jgi:hypothetical protein